MLLSPNAAQLSPSVCGCPQMLPSPNAARSVCGCPQMLHPPNACSPNCCPQMLPPQMLPTTFRRAEARSFSCEEKGHLPFWYHGFSLSQGTWGTWGHPQGTWGHPQSCSLFKLDFQFFKVKSDVRKPVSLEKTGTATLKATILTEISIRGRKTAQQQDTWLRSDVQTGDTSSRGLRLRELTQTEPASGKNFCTCNQPDDVRLENTDLRINTPRSCQKLSNWAIPRSSVCVASPLEKTNCCPPDFDKCCLRQMLQPLGCAVMSKLAIQVAEGYA